MGSHQEKHDETLSLSQLGVIGSIHPLTTSSDLCHQKATLPMVDPFFADHFNKVRTDFRKKQWWLMTLPIGSMGLVYLPILMVNVVKYAIHGSYGIIDPIFSIAVDSPPLCFPAVCRNGSVPSYARKWQRMHVQMLGLDMDCNLYNFITYLVLLYIHDTCIDTLIHIVRRSQADPFPLAFFASCRNGLTEKKVVDSKMQP